jgi:hypothetical protein
MYSSTQFMNSGQKVILAASMIRALIASYATSLLRLEADSAIFHVYCDHTFHVIILLML